MSIQTGKTMLFKHYKAHAGIGNVVDMQHSHEPVLVGQEIPVGISDYGDSMWEVTFQDGHVLNAFEDELFEIDDA